MCGQLRETNKNGELIRLHVFARSPNSPYKYFHRTWSKYRKWSAWQKIQGDIQGVENGARSGVHLVPVFWKNRIFLFWPMFTVRHDTSSNDGQTPRESADSTSATLQGFKYWEVRLAWSEFVDGKWSPKQISKDFIKQEYWHYIPDEPPSDLHRKSMTTQPGNISRHKFCG